MLSQSLTEEIIGRALSSGGDYAEVFVEDTIRNTLILSSKGVDTAITGEDYGASVRVFRGVNCIYTYTNDTSRKSLLELASRAASAIGTLGADRPITMVERYSLNRTPIKTIPSSVPNRRKAEVLHAIYAAAIDYSPEVVQCVVTHRDVDQKIFIATSDGSYTTDRRVYTRLYCRAVASDGEQNQTGISRPDSQAGMELYEMVPPEALGREAGQKAVNMLHARPSPTGEMPVVINNGNGAVFFHEACGHSLESAAVSLGVSLFGDKLGQKIASEKVTAIDDGTIPGGWGSLNVDDEGVPTTRNVLIEKGVLKGFMIDRLGGRRMNMPPTGCGRKESYRFCPTSRMTNTYIAAGDDADADIIGSIDHGLFAASIGGGTANTQTGAFNFNVLEAYLIRNGQIAYPVRGATIIGMAGEALKCIEMVGKALSFGPGMCGASSGSLPVSSGQPMIKLSRLTVGGK